MALSSFGFGGMPPSLLAHGLPDNCPFVDERAETLCRRIVLYRSYLRQGVDAALAVDYLREIAEAEAALAELLQRRSGSPWSSCFAARRAPRLP